MRQQVLSVVVDNLSMDETVERVAAFVRDGRPHQHVVVNADKVVKAAKDPALAQIIADCDLVNADGMPVLWAARALGQPLKERVTGIDLFYRLMAEAERRRWRVYFLGAKEEIVREVERRAKDAHPSLPIAGARNGYWSPEEEAGVVQAIADSRCDLLFVAISSPKKEQFLARYQALMKVPFAMGVGGSFDVMAGLTRRAPVWMQKTGLEWFYRFLQEPRRMFRRYFIDDMGFFWLLAKALAQRASKKSVATSRP
jgi:N-acetylglucosaminyldiphosphoundecaprenol N-acetyl-beta-D-mannosaminyltransferase